MPGEPRGPRGSPLLFLSAHLPSSQAREAGHRIAYEHLRALAGAHSVTLVALANKRERASVDGSLYQLCDAVHLIPVNQATRLAGLLRRPDLPLYVAGKYRGSVARLVSEACRAHPGLLVWVEYTQMAQYFGALSGNAVAVVMCQDILGQLFSRWAAAAKGLARLVLRWEWSRLRSWEAEVLRSAHQVVVLSHKDLALVREFGVEHVVVGYPAPTQLPPPGRPREPDPRPTIIFFGAMNRRENIDAVDWFLTAIFPLVRSEVSDARVVVAGASPPDTRRKAWGQSEGVVVTGLVSNPSVVLAEAWVAVAPMRLGAGLKLKVLEYLAHGLPVVATQIGAEGIPADGASGLVVADGPNELAEACISLLSDRGRREAAAAAARNWYLNEYQPRELTSDRMSGILDAARIRAGSGGPRAAGGRQGGAGRAVADDRGGP